MPRHLGTTGDAHACRKITYPGANNKTEMTYSPTGGRIKIAETVSGSVTSTKQFVGNEERDGSGAVTKQFFSRGFTAGSSSYFYDLDHIGSVRSVTDNTGVVQVAYNFDSYGRGNKLEGTLDSDFGFSGMYLHSRSGLNLTLFRAYSPLLGTWISRDPIEESGGLNLYSYGSNDPVDSIDPLGLEDFKGPAIDLKQPGVYNVGTPGTDPRYIGKGPFARMQQSRKAKGRTQGLWRPCGTTESAEKAEHKIMMKLGGPTKPLQGKPNPKLPWNRNYSPGRFLPGLLPFDLMVPILEQQMKDTGIWPYETEPLMA